MPLTPSERQAGVASLYSTYNDEQEQKREAAATHTQDWFTPPEEPPEVTHGPAAEEVESRLDLVRQQTDDDREGRKRNPGEYSPRYYQPLTRTVRGVDLSTGKRELSRGDEANPLIEEDTMAGVELLRQSNMSTTDGPDEVGMQGMARVARATLREGGSYDDVKRYLSQYGASDDRVHAAVNIAEEAMLSEDLSTGYSQPFTDEEIAEVRDAETQYDEQSLLLEDDWVNAARVVWEAENNSQWDGTRQDLWQYGLETMSKFANNISGMPGMHPESMSYYTTQAISRGAYDDNQYAKALFTMLDMYDRTDISAQSVGRGVKAMAPWNDPVGWLAGGALLNAARRVGLRRMKKILNESAILGGTEGGLYVGGEELARQVVAVEAGAQDEVSLGQVGMMTGAGIIAGYGVSRSFDFIASPEAIAKYKKWGKALMDKFDQDSNFVPVQINMETAQ